MLETDRQEFSEDQKCITPDLAVSLAQEMAKKWTWAMSSLVIL